jgi:hypothetical protein
MKPSLNPPSEPLSQVEVVDSVVPVKTILTGVNEMSLISSAFRYGNSIIDFALFITAAVADNGCNKKTSNKIKKTFFKPAPEHVFLPLP